MARTQLATFKYDNQTVYVFTGEKSLDVYYQRGEDSKYSAGISWNPKRGDYKSGSGEIMSNDEGLAHIRSLLSN